MYTKEELKTLKKEFWEGFDIFCSNNKELKLYKKKWLLYDTKVKGVDLKFDATRQGAFVIMEVNLRDEYERIELFEKIVTYKNIIQEYFNEELVWDYDFVREAGNRVCRVYVQKTGIDIHRRIQWMEFYNFMARNMLHMESAFEDIKDFLK